MTETRPASPTRISVAGLAATAWLTGTTFLALFVLYLVGLDQGATSIFGSDTRIHEFVHDAAHLLGYPCY